MREQKLVSIVVPVRNVGRHIDDCMLSLRLQDQQECEIIVVEDRCTDDSVDIVRHHAQLDSRIRIIETLTPGAGAARNVGIRHAAGDFISFVDADDMIPRRYVSSLVGQQRDGDFDVVTTGFRRITEESRALSKDIPKKLPKLSVPLSDYEGILGLYRPSGPWGRLYRRSLLVENRLEFPEGVEHEDLFFVYKVLYNCKHSYSTELPSYYWRMRPDSASRSLTQQHLEATRLLRDDALRFLEHRSATAREHALAARRNIVFLRALLRRWRGGTPEQWATFVKFVRKERDKILEDLSAIEDTSFNLPVPELRKVVRAE